MDSIASHGLSPDGTGLRPTPTPDARAMDRDYDARVPLKIMARHLTTPILQRNAPLSSQVSRLRLKACVGSREKPLNGSLVPNRLLENRTPLEAIETDFGLQLVATILGRIEYGVFS